MLFGQAEEIHKMYVWWVWCVLREWFSDPCVGSSACLVFQKFTRCSASTQRQPVHVLVCGRLPGLTLSATQTRRPPNAMNFIRQLEVLKKSGEDNDFSVHWIELLCGFSFQPLFAACQNRLKHCSFSQTSHGQIEKGMVDARRCLSLVQVQSEFCNVSRQLPSKFVLI